jgi:hypothetical protein
MFFPKKKCFIVLENQKSQPHIKKEEAASINSITVTSSMGPANSIVSNRVDKPLTIMTFNNADFAYQNYKNLYFVAPWGESQVDAAADAWGLKVAVVYGVVGDQMLYRMWGCGNGSTLTVNSISYDQIDATGCDHIGTGSINGGSDTMQGVLDWTGLSIDAASAAGGFLFP